MLVDPGKISSGTIPYFGFLDGEGSSNTYMEMPVESSSANLLIGKWQITKLGIDEANDGNIVYYRYEDYDHKDCGESFLQFNSDGVVFENSYYNNTEDCILYSEIDTYEFIDSDRLKIYVYDNIFLVNLSATELILKYDWAFPNSLWGPTQVYYHYKRA
ncbi:hypothetical protein GCM10011361_12250 [Muriicola marianensis]|uniref:Lipocalin-like domain-containing protein n=2 Tax=Muriicola marianensis TaxID=1324801 RepID=A0ABQ1QUL0_9FLAO|nr:hypothetical protein GCM10011361_12250 [Muriicola marianensis]